MSARIRPLLLGTLLFLSGALAALLVEHSFLLHRRAQARPTIPHAVLAQLDSTLRLTPAQHDSVRLIFARHQPRVDSAWRTINHRLYVAMDTVHLELQRVLDGEQWERFQEWLRHQHGPVSPTHQR